MSFDRREFLCHATVMTVGLGARAGPLTAQQRPSTVPTARATALMAALGLRYPIFCAGMAAAAGPGALRLPCRTGVALERSAPALSGRQT